MLALPYISKPDDRRRRSCLSSGSGDVGRQTLAVNGQSDRVELGGLPLHLDGFVLIGG